MLDFSRSALLWLVALILTACSSTPQIRVMTDAGVDFSGYQRFAFYEPLGTDQEQYVSLVSQYLKSATRAEMESRGFTYSENEPELLINFSASLEERLRTTQTPTTAMIALRPSWNAGYYGYRRGLYSEFPLYQTEVRSYTEGTLNIDIVDADQKRLLWEGVAVGSVTQRTLDNIRPAIEDAVQRIFARFPLPPQTATR